MKKLYFSFTLLILLSCGKSSPKTDMKSANQVINFKDSIRAIKSLMKPEMKESSEENKGLLVKQNVVLGKYKIEFGYTAYNEEKYGFDNPGYLKVFKNNKVIFSDSFLGDHELFVFTLDNKVDNNLFFTLNWGKEACDYQQTSRFYCITTDDKVHKLGDHWTASSGDGYSSRSFEHFYKQNPQDNSSQLLVIESLFFHEHDKKDLIDTIVYTLKENNFKSTRLSNHLKSDN